MTRLPWSSGCPPSPSLVPSTRSGRGAAPARGSGCPLSPQDSASGARVRATAVPSSHTGEHLPAEPGCRGGSIASV